MGYVGVYYWKGKMFVVLIFLVILFGMNVQEMNGWLYYGGGLKFWQDLYKLFGVVFFVGGNIGVQMVGWFKKEINSFDDFQGLKMCILGLGGEVFKVVGGILVILIGGEIFMFL